LPYQFLFSASQTFDVSNILAALIDVHFRYKIDSEMTSVLYSGGLNYQSGNPVRQEIVNVRREVDSLRKQVELLVEENAVLKKHMMILLQATENGVTPFVKDMQSISDVKDMQAARPAGGGTVQGGGFRR